MAQQVFPPLPGGESGASTSSASLDAELVAHSLQGSREAFAALFDRHAPRVFAVAHGLVGNRTDAEDITQDTFLQALSALPTLRQADLFGAWVARIATNTALNALRRRGRLPQAVLDEAIVDAHADTARWVSPEAMGLAAEDRHSVRITLNRLAPSHRTALTLREIGGLSYAEIAQALGTTPGGVETLLFRARARFRDEYAKVTLGAVAKSTTTCTQAQGALAALADGELAAARQAEVVSHVRSCGACATTLREQREAHRLLAALPVAIPASVKLGTLAHVGPILAGHAAAGAAGGAATAVTAGGVATGSAAASTAGAAAAGSAAAGAALAGSATAGGTAAVGSATIAGAGAAAATAGSAAVSSAAAGASTVAGGVVAATSTLVGSAAAGASTVASGVAAGASTLVGSVAAGASALTGSVAAGASTLFPSAIVGVGASGAVAKVAAVVVTSALVTGLLTNSPAAPSSVRIAAPHKADTAQLSGRPGPQQARARVPHTQPRRVARQHSGTPHSAPHAAHPAPHVVQGLSYTRPSLVAIPLPPVGAIATISLPQYSATPSNTPTSMPTSPSPLIPAPVRPAAPPATVPTMMRHAAAATIPSRQPATAPAPPTLTPVPPDNAAAGAPPPPPVVAMANSGTNNGIAPPLANPPATAVAVPATAVAARFSEKTSMLPVAPPPATPTQASGASGVNGSSAPALLGGASAAVSPTPIGVGGDNGPPTPAASPVDGSSSGTPTATALAPGSNGGTPTVEPPNSPGSPTASAANPLDSATPTALSADLPSPLTGLLPTLDDPSAPPASPTVVPADASSDNSTGVEPADTAIDVPTETAVPTDAPTETAVPSDTPTDTATETSVPSDTPTETVVPSDTPTSIPTDTAIPSDTPTATDVTWGAPPDGNAVPIGGQCPPPTATTAETPPSTPASSDMGLVDGASATGTPIAADGDDTSGATIQGQPTAMPTDASSDTLSATFDSGAVSPLSDGGGAGTSSIVEGSDQPTATDVPTAVGSPCPSGDAPPAPSATDAAETMQAQPSATSGADTGGWPTAQSTDTVGTPDDQALDSAGAQPTPTAQAAPSITLAAASDGSGQESVSGAGFTPGETVTLCWNDPAAGGATATVGDDGTFTVALDAPPAGTGTLTLLAQGSGGDQAVATASF